MKLLPFAFSALILGTSLSNQAFAETDNDTWTEVGGYLLAVSIDGDTTMSNVETDLDVSFGDILENLDLAAMAFVEHRRGKWSFMMDGLFMDLSSDSTIASNGTLQVNTDADVFQGMVAGFVGYRFFDKDYDQGNLGIDVLGGVRYNDVDVELDVNASALGLTTAASRKSGDEWLDAVVGLRGQYTHNNGWGASGWVDIGEGEDSSSYQIAGFVNYSFENNIRAYGGYRLYAMDYEDGAGASHFAIDADYAGPMIGASYRF